MFIQTQLINFEEKKTKDRWKILTNCLENLVKQNKTNLINNEKYLDMLTVSLQSPFSKMRRVAAFLMSYHLRYDSNSEALTKKYGFCRKNDNIFLVNTKRLDQDNKVKFKLLIKAISQDLKSMQMRKDKKLAIFYYFPFVYNPIEKLLVFDNDNLKLLRAYADPNSLPDPTENLICIPCDFFYDVASDESISSEDNSIDERVQDINNDQTGYGQIALKMMTIQRIDTSQDDDEEKKKESFYSEKTESEDSLNSQTSYAKAKKCMDKLFVLKKKKIMDDHPKPYKIQPKVLFYQKQKNRYKSVQNTPMIDQINTYIDRRPSFDSYERYSQMNFKQLGNNKSRNIPAFRKDNIRIQRKAYTLQNNMVRINANFETKVNDRSSNYSGDLSDDMLCEINHNNMLASNRSINPDCNPAVMIRDIKNKPESSYKGTIRSQQGSKKHVMEAPRRNSNIVESPVDNNKNQAQPTLKGFFQKNRKS